MKASTIQAEALDCVSLTSKRRRRVTFIEHHYEKETSSVRSDMLSRAAPDRSFILKGQLAYYKQNAPMALPSQSKLVRPPNCERSGQTTVVMSRAARLT